MSHCDCKKTIVSEKGPRAIGPYSIAVQAKRFIFTAGQIGLNPSTGELVKGGLEAETRQALDNLKAILKAANASMEDVVKTTVFLKDINDFARMNVIYAEYFEKDPPARSAIQVAALPKNALIEVESIAFTCDCDKHEEKSGCCCK